MDGTFPRQGGEDDRIVLGLLNSVGNGATSQRRIAGELGITLGLVNAYLKRCVKKVLIKVGEASTRRYAYYLPPYGFTEKSRLTVEYLSSSFSFFRQAKVDCKQVFAIARSRNLDRFVLRGRSDLAEVAIVSAIEGDASIAAVIDPDSEPAQFFGKAVLHSYSELASPVDAVIVTDVKHAPVSYDEAVQLFGSDRVLAPRLLGLG